MPDYITMADMAAKIPGKQLIQSLDDNQDGVADPEVWAAVLKAAQDEVDSKLAQQYDVPFVGSIPPMVALATLIFASEGCYARRGKTGDKNPFTKQADKIRTKLDKIGAGDEPLLADSKRKVPSGGLILEKAKTVSSSGKTTS